MWMPMVDAEGFQIHRSKKYLQKQKQKIKSQLKEIDCMTDTEADKVQKLTDLGINDR